MREKLAFLMAFARAPHACTKRDRQAYLEQFHQPRITCAAALRSATKPLSATFHDSSSCASSSGAATGKSVVVATSGTVVINRAKGSSSSAYSELPCAAARRRAPSSESPSEASSEKVGRANFCECNACNRNLKVGDAVRSS